MRWKDHNITKVLLKYLEELNKESWLAFQQGHYLCRETEQARVVGNLELASRIITFDDDHMVVELEGILSDEYEIKE